MKTIGKMEKRKEDKPLGLNDHLTFGKHKGKKISTAIDIDRRYVIWIKDKNFIKLNEEAEDYLSGIINANGYDDELDGGLSDWGEYDDWGGGDK